MHNWYNGVSLFFPCALSTSFRNNNNNRKKARAHSVIAKKNTRETTKKKTSGTKFTEWKLDMCPTLFAKLFDTMRTNSRSPTKYCPLLLFSLSFSHSLACQIFALSLSVWCNNRLIYLPLMLLLLFSLFVIDDVVLVVKLETTKLLDFEINISSKQPFSTSLSPASNPWSIQHSHLHSLPILLSRNFQTANHKQQTSSSPFRRMHRRIHKLDMEYLGGKVFAFLIDTNYQKLFTKKREHKVRVRRVFNTNNTMGREVEWDLTFHRFVSILERLRNDDERRESWKFNQTETPVHKSICVWTFSNLNKNKIRRWKRWWKPVYWKNRLENWTGVFFFKGEKLSSNYWLYGLVASI